LHKKTIVIVFNLSNIVKTVLENIPSRSEVFGMIDMSVGGMEIS